MPKPTRALVAGNWKMNGLRGSLKEVRLLAGMLNGVSLNCDILVCPPATLLPSMASLVRGTRIVLGGQDCHSAQAGAHTGDISAAMLKDAGAKACIVGHSERRSDHGEGDDLVQAKASCAHDSGLTAIICVGENLQQRESGETLDVVTRQLIGSIPASATSGNTVIAYEPVWAIGTGLTAMPQQVAEVHAGIRAKLCEILGDEEGDSVRILYGGSVKPSNAVELMGTDEVNGALVGGASLKAADFIGIIKAYA